MEREGKGNKQEGKKKTKKMEREGKGIEKGEQREKQLRE